MALVWAHITKRATRISGLKRSVTKRTNEIDALYTKWRWRLWGSSYDKKAKAVQFVIFSI